MNLTQRAIAVGLAVLLGYAAKRLGVSPPAPPNWEGVVLIAAVVLGYKLG